MVFMTREISLIANDQLVTTLLHRVDLATYVILDQCDIQLLGLNKKFQRIGTLHQPGLMNRAHLVHIDRQSYTWSEVMVGLCQQPIQNHFGFIQSIVQGQMYMLCPLKWEGTLSAEPNLSIYHAVNSESALPLVDL